MRRNGRKLKTLALLIYGLQMLAKAWPHIPFGHTVFAGPQAHVAVTFCSVAHGASEALAGALCPFASANPTDMAVASNAMANVLSMVSSSLNLGSETIFEAT